MKWCFIEKTEDKGLQTDTVTLLIIHFNIIFHPLMFFFFFFYLEALIVDQSFDDWWELSIAGKNFLLLVTHNPKDVIWFGFSQLWYTLTCLHTLQYAILSHAPIALHGKLPPCRVTLRTNLPVHADLKKKKKQKVKVVVSLCLCCSVRSSRAQLDAQKSGSCRSRSSLRGAADWVHKAQTPAGVIIQD